MKERIILHSDLNSFYASVEMYYNPELRGKAIAVVGDKEMRGGIVLAKSEKAKACGVKTGDVLWEAKQKCPDIIFVPARHNLYIEASEKVRAIYNRYTPQVEHFGIDESWLDVTGCGRSGKEIADEIREAIKREVGITASIGVSFNKIFAKLGSDLKKPDATVVISREDWKGIVHPLPASDLLGVGRKTRAKLEKFAIKKIGDIARVDVKFLKTKFGVHGEQLWLSANGLDNSPVTYSHEDDDLKSIGNSSTSCRDLDNLTDVKMMLQVLAESVAERMRSKKLKGGVVHLSVRDLNLKWWGKQMRTVKPINTAAEIIKTALGIFTEYNFKEPVRSIGVSVGNLTSEISEQLSLFDNNKQEQIERTMDKIRNKHGHKIICRGITALDKKLTNVKH